MGVPGAHVCARMSTLLAALVGRRPSRRAPRAGAFVTGRDRALHAGPEGAWRTGPGSLYVPGGTLSGGGRGARSSVLACRVPGAGSLAGCSPRGHEEPDTAEPPQSALSSFLLLFPGKQQVPTFEGGCQCFHILYCVAQKSKETACNVGDLDSAPESGRSPGKGKGNPLQYSWASLAAQLVKNLLVMQ